MRLVRDSWKHSLLIITLFLMDFFFPQWVSLNLMWENYPGCLFLEILHFVFLCMTGILKPIFISLVFLGVCDKTEYSLQIDQNQRQQNRAEPLGLKIHSDRLFSQLCSQLLLSMYVFVLKLPKWVHNVFLNLISSIHRAQYNPFLSLNSWEHSWENSLENSWEKNPV